MAASPGGKSVGRVSIRVIPDTSDFRNDLRKRLAVIEKNTTMQVTVDRVKIDAAKVRESIRQQFEKLDKVEVDADVRAVIDKVTVKRTEVRKSVQEQFDEMGIRVKVTAEVENTEGFKKQIHDMVKDAEKGKVKITVNAATAGATAQMAWLSRDRIVTLIPELSKSAVAKVATQLAALSGARLAFEWVDNIRDFLSNLDKSLPKIGALTSGIGAAVAMALSLVSGLVGIGAGLASIGPAFLVLPGLVLGLGFAIATFAIAMKDAKAQLDPLADSMNELGSIIKADFWEGARGPIIDLVTTLMPQLRTAFSEVATSLGNFSGGLADAFKQELAGGRLLELFRGISESFDILTTGAGGFAGAIVSLSAIAAQYAPRLATWFVDIANQFDAWLKATAEDGRMTQWIDAAIASIKDLGRVVTGVTGIFVALWTAAEAAGGGGLKGFADNLHRISDVMNGPVFQGTLTAFFVAAGEASSFLADALLAVGDMLVYLETPLSLLLSTAGAIIGQLVTDLAAAMSSPAVAGGLTDFITGLQVGFAAFGEQLPVIMPALAAILSLAGTLAATLGPVLGEVLAALAPAFTLVVEALIPLIPILGEQLSIAIATVAPLLLELVEKLLPILPDLVNAIVLTLPRLIDLFNALWPIVSTVIDWLIGLVEVLLTPTSEAFQNIINWIKSTGPMGQFLVGVFTVIGNIIDATMVVITAVIRKFAPIIADIWNGLWGMVGDFFRNAWNTIVSNAAGFIGGFISLFNALPADIKGALSGAANWLIDTGKNIIDGLIKGVTNAAGRAVAAVKKVADDMVAGVQKFLDINSPSGVFKREVGAHIPTGIAEGILDGGGAIDAAIKHVVAVPKGSSFLPDLSSLAGGGASTSSIFNASFALAPQPGVPLADQVFAAAQRLKARTA